MLKFDWNILFTFVNLIIFYLLMRKFLFGRIKKVMDARKELIQKQFDDAAETAKQADEKLADYEAKIADVEAEGEQIIAEAKDDAKAEYDKIIKRAEADAAALKADAEKQIEIDTMNAKKAAKEEIASLAMQAAEKVVGKSVSAENDSDIFDDFLKESSEE
ncbi:MAG: F0F1 ATP synthase subunit B [Ruminococcaceae bacterium]|jgi:F-type H+-transporting ATPase subunit b|nr:F0F1 ATP synthase subunit B [Oscillospiraceae bacterium]